MARVHAALRLDDRVLADAGAPARRGGAVVTVTGLPSSPRPYSLRYWLWGESARGSVVGALGSSGAPLRVLIEADQAPLRPRRWYHKWWIWTVAGAGLTAAAVVTAVVVYRPATEARLGTP